MKRQLHEDMIQSLIISKFNQSPKFISRIKVGICNEVYLVGLAQKEVIVRLNSHNRYLLGSHDHIPKFKDLGIPVPDILAEDYTQQFIPLSYQILSKIEGQDLGQVIETLSDSQLKELAREVAGIFQKVSSIPTSDKFGVIWGGGDDELSDSWTERMQIWIDESKERGLATGVMDDEMLRTANILYEKYLAYFVDVFPTMYYGDICSKNIMINQGAFSGLVDLDGLTQGDPLEAIGRIKLSWYDTRHGTTYINALMDTLRLSQEQREHVTVYALLNQISWTCENGIQFNQNTRAELNWPKAYQDKKNLRRLAQELNIG